MSDSFLSYNEAMKEKNCIECGISFMPSGRNQKRCGSVTGKTGCSIKHHSFLATHSKDGTRRKYKQCGRDCRSMQHLLCKLQDNDKCALCGSIENLTVDHIRPRSGGGTDEISNLRVLCRKCNRNEYHKLVKRALIFYFTN